MSCECIFLPVDLRIAGIVLSPGAGSSAAADAIEASTSSLNRLPRKTLG